MAGSAPAFDSFQNASNTQTATPSTSLALGRFLSRNEAWLWTLVVVATLIDGITTYAGMRSGLNEANPFIRIAVAQIGYLGIGLIKTGVLILVVGIRASLSSHRGPIVPLACLLPWGGAAILNVMHLTG